MTKLNELLTDGSDWTDDGVVFFIDTEPIQDGFLPVYHLRSDRLNDHFYTTRQKEIDSLTGAGSDIWTCDGIVWYAYGPPPQ